MKKLASSTLISLAGLLSASAAVTDNLVAYWNFEGNTSNNAAATGGTAYNGALMGNATTTGTPKSGTGALLLDGSGDYMDVTSVVDVTQPWSASAWFRSDISPATTVRGMVFETSGSYAMSFNVREGTPTTNTNFQVFTDYATGTDPQRDLQVADTATANTWHHILISFTPATVDTAGSLTGYLDGIASYSVVIPIGTTLAAANGFHVGTYRSANDRWFDGSIDEVALWNRSLSAADATEVYSRGNQGDSLTTVKYSVALTASPAGQGTVSGTGVYDPGAQVPVSATANPGYAFVEWVGSFTGQPASFIYTANASATATASFRQDIADTDGDGLSNYEEIVLLQTLPNNADTDGDQIPDGAEVDITSTSPTVSDAALVAFVEQNLCPNPHAGAIALEAPRIERNPSTGLISLFLGLSGSADQQVWAPVNLNGPSVSITPAADGWNITIPAPSSSVNSYVLLGSKR